MTEEVEMPEDNGGADEHGELTAGDVWWMTALGAFTLLLLMTTFYSLGYEQGQQEKVRRFGPCVDSQMPLTTGMPPDFGRLPGGGPTPKLMECWAW